MTLLGRGSDSESQEAEGCWQRRGWGDARSGQRERATWGCSVAGGVSGCQVDSELPTATHPSAAIGPVPLYFHPLPISVCPVPVRPHLYPKPLALGVCSLLLLLSAAHPDTWFSLFLPPARPSLTSCPCLSRPGFDLMAAFGLVQEEYASIRGVAMEPSAFGPTRTFTLFKDAQLTRRTRWGRGWAGTRAWTLAVVGWSLAPASPRRQRARCHTLGALTEPLTALGRSSVPYTACYSWGN